MATSDLDSKLKAELFQWSPTYGALPFPTDEVASTIATSMANVYGVVIQEMEERIQTLESRIESLEDHASDSTAHLSASSGA